MWPDEGKTTKSQKFTELVVEDACGVLIELGCSSDPMFINGFETTPDSVMYGEMECPTCGSLQETPTPYKGSGFILAEELQIEFFSDYMDGKVKGSLLDMLLDRMGLELA